MPRKSTAVIDPPAAPLEEEPVEQLEGEHGMIYPFDDDRFAVFVTNPRLIPKVAALPGAVYFTHGDGEATLHIPRDVHDAAAALIGAKVPKKRGRSVATATPRKPKPTSPAPVPAEAVATPPTPRPLPPPSDLFSDW